MKKIFLLILLTALLLSCSEHEYLTDTSLSVGNIYCSDGSVINPNSYKESEKKAIGVIFWVNEDPEQTTDRAYAVALEDLNPEQWCDTLVNIGAVSDDQTSFNGASNTTSIIAWGLSETRKTPAATQAYNYTKQEVSGWFIPSVAQAKELYHKKNIMYQSFKTCDGISFENVWYWTSTQDGTGTDGATLNAISISLTEGKATVSNKMNTFAVRPIIAIK